MNYIDTTDCLRKAAALIDLKAAAQAVLDLERPGETVAEILINSDSAKSLKELLTPAPAPTPATQRAVYRVMAHDPETDETWVSNNVQQNRFDTLSEALLGKDKATLSPSIEYFIEKSFEA